MFQPQPPPQQLQPYHQQPQRSQPPPHLLQHSSPFSSFSPYGVAVATPTPPYPAFASPARGLVVDSGGPTFVRDPVFHPRADANGGVGALAFGSQFSKMAEHNLEAQEALARDFQPALEVSKQAGCCGWC